MIMLNIPRIQSLASQEGKSWITKKLVCEWKNELIIF